MGLRGASNAAGGQKSCGRVVFQWPGASLLLGHRSIRICSLIVPRYRPFGAQHKASHWGDTALARGVASGEQQHQGLVEFHRSPDELPKRPEMLQAYSKTSSSVLDQIWG